MKILFILSIFMSLCSCSLVTNLGSQDIARVPESAAPYIASTMMKDIRSYPHSVVTPHGRPIYNAFNNEFQRRSWSIRPLRRFEPKGWKGQSRYITITTTKLSSNDTLVKLNNPYFTISQSFHYDNLGNVSESSQTNLNIKEHE